MTTGDLNGHLSGVKLEKDQSLKQEINKNSDWFFIYLFSGKVEVLFNDINTVVGEGDLLILEKSATFRLNIKSLEYSELTFVEITPN